MSQQPAVPATPANRSRDARLAAFPIFMLADTRQPVLMGLGLFLLVLPLAAMYSPIAAMLSELFPTRLRYTGNSLAYQVGTLAGGAFVPMIATTLYEVYESSKAISAYLFTWVSIGLVAVQFVPETSRMSLEDAADGHAGHAR